MGPAEGGDGHKIYDPTTKRMNTSRDVFFLEGRAKPQFHLSTVIEGRDKGGDVLSDFQDISSSTPDQDGPTRAYTEEQEDEVPLRRTFHLPPGVGQPNRVKRAAPALDTPVYRPPTPHQSPASPQSTIGSPESDRSTPVASPGTPSTRNASDRDETGETGEIDETGGELGEIRGEDVDERGIRDDDAGRNGEDDENDADDGALAPRRSTRTNKGQITKDYWMNKPRDEAGHGLCAFTATDSEFASHPPT